MQSLFSSLHGLRHLSLQESPHKFTDQELLNFLINNPDLTVLRLGNTACLSVAAAEILAAYGMNIRRLTLNGCSDELKVAIDQKRSQNLESFSIGTDLYTYF